MKDIKFAFHKNSALFRLMLKARELKKWDKSYLYNSYMIWLGDQFVFTNHFEPDTIYIGLRQFFTGWKPSVSLVINAISHETLHGVLIKMGEMEACKALDRFVNEKNVTKTGLKRF